MKKIRIATVRPADVAESGSPLQDSAPNTLAVAGLSAPELRSKAHRTLAISALCACLAACATTPIPTQQASPVPSERVLDGGKKLALQSANTGEVVVKRDAGITGSGCSTRIYVDGTPVADIKVAEKVVLHLPEGEHILSAQPNGICSGVMTEVKTTVKPRTQSAFRFGTSGNGSPSIYPTAF